MRWENPPKTKAKGRMVMPQNQRGGRLGAALLLVAGICRNDGTNSCDKALFTRYQQEESRTRRSHGAILCGHLGLGLWWHWNRHSAWRTWS